MSRVNQLRRFHRKETNSANSQSPQNIKRLGQQNLHSVGVGMHSVVDQVFCRRDTFYNIVFRERRDVAVDLVHDASE